jgi:hypothetical protein
MWDFVDRKLRDGILPIVTKREGVIGHCAITWSCEPRSEKRKKEERGRNEEWREGPKGRKGTRAIFVDSSKRNSGLPSHRCFESHSLNY